jgi:hypothetical protein
MTATAVSVVWNRREPPLQPTAVVARGDAVPALAAATAQRLSAGVELKVCMQAGWLLVLGQEADLPWADDVCYLGWDSGVLVPTTHVCQPSADLVRRGLASRLPDADSLVVLLGVDVLVTRLPTRPPVPAQLGLSG